MKFAFLYPLFILFALFVNTLNAQVVVTSAGGNAKSTGGSVSYTVGQVVYTPEYGLPGSVFQGVQQPYEIYIISSINDVQAINADITLYPNPVSDVLRLTIEGVNHSSYLFKLININGKILEVNQVNSQESVIRMGKYDTGTYFLKVSSSALPQESETFKIIKK